MEKTSTHSSYAAALVSNGVRKILSVIAIMSIVFAHVTPVFGATRTFTNATWDGDWSNAGNWDAFPATTDDVVITNGGITAIDGGSAEANSAQFSFSRFAEGLTLTLNGGSGTATFSSNEDSPYGNEGAIYGNVTFSNNAGNGGTINGTATFNTGTSNYGTINGSVIFNGNSQSGTINAGDAGTISGDFDNGGITIQSGVVSSNVSGAGELTKSGSGTTTLTGGGNNTYSGTTAVNEGMLVLDKNASGTTAVAGDITIAGGTLRFDENNQIADTSTITMTSGELNLNGKTETVTAFSNSGGTFTTGAGHLTGTGATVTWSGGTNTINDGGKVEDGHMVITGGTNTVQGGVTGGVLQLNALKGDDSPGLLEMSNGSTLTLNSDAGVAGTLLLQCNVSTSGDATVTIANGGVAANKGTIDLDGGTRIFTVADGTNATDLAISAVIANGSLTKAGTGALTLSGANTYTGDTTVTGGGLTVTNGLFFNGGSINTTCGNDADGADFSVSVSEDIDISGTVTTSGGTSTGADGYSAGDVTLYSSMGAVSSGAIIANGSNAPGSGGRHAGGGGDVNVSCSTTMTLASIVAQGGIDSTTVENYGGDGGTVTLSGGTANSIGAIDTTGGAGYVGSGNGGAVSIGVTSADITSITTSGGGHIGFSLYGGSGGDISFSGDIHVTGAVDTTGGVGATANGAGGDVTVESGVVTVDGNIATAAGSGSGEPASAGKLILNGGTLNFASLTGGGDVNFGGGTLQYGAGNVQDLSSQIKDSASAIKIDTNGNNITYASAIASSNTGGLTKSGAGTLTLSGVNAYTGATTIREGTVNFNQSLTASALNFSGDGTAVFASGTNVTEAITNDTQNQGTVTFSNGNHTVSGDIGSTGTGVKRVQVGTFDTHFNGDVKATSFAFTGNGGNISVAAGKSITLQDAALTVNTNGASTINYLGSTTIANDLGTSAMRLAYINFNGGTAILGANIYTDPTSQGGLGKTTIDNATVTLTGDRTVGGALKLQNGGAVDVGANTLTTDSYTQSSGTALNLTANSNALGDYGNIVASGDVTITGGTINVTVGGYLANGATLDIITSGGTLAYAGVTLTPYEHYTFTSAVSGGVLRLTANRAENGFASDAGGNSNSAAVGSVLDNISGASGDMLNVLNTLDGMSSGAVGTSLGTMTPDVSSGAAEGSRSLTSQGFTMVSNRLGGARGGGMSGSSGVSSGEMTEGLGVWMQGLGSNMKQKERKGIEGYSANLFGTTIGADKVLDRHFRAGLAGSYGYANVKSKTPGNPSDNINSYQATLYGSYDSLDLCEARQGGKKSPEAVRTQVEDSWYVDGMLAFTQNNYDSRREIWVGSAKRVAKADHYGQQYSTNFETGYKFVFEETKDLEVTPFAGLGYNYLYMNKYKEKGADALNLHVEGEGFHQLEQSLGMKLAYPIVNKKLGTFIPSGKAAWLYDYIGDRFETTASFAGGGASFDTVGAKPAKSGMLFGAELAFLNKGNMTVTGNWDIEIKDEFLSNTYYGTVRYDF